MTPSPRRLTAMSSALELPPRSDRFRAGSHVPPARRCATCAAVQAPLYRAQATNASPSPSIATCGRDALRPAPERTSGPLQAPDAPRRAACTTRYAPFDHCHAATAPPWSSIATAGPYVLPTGPETVSGVDQVPSIVRDDDCTSVLRSRSTSQTAVACPASTATSALKAESPGAERSVGSLQLLPAGRTAACTTLSRPFERCQTATALPRRSIASSGASVAAAGPEIARDEPNAAPFGR